MLIVNVRRSSAIRFGCKPREKPKYGEEGNKSQQVGYF